MTSKAELRDEIAGLHDMLNNVRSQRDIAEKKFQDASAAVDVLTAKWAQHEETRLANSAAHVRDSRGLRKAAGYVLQASPSGWGDVWKYEPLGVPEGQSHSEALIKRIHALHALETDPILDSRTVGEVHGRMLFEIETYVQKRIDRAIPPRIRGVLTVEGVEFTQEAWAKHLELVAKVANSRPNLPNLGLATNNALVSELSVRFEFGHTDGDYRTAGN